MARGDDAAPAGACDGSVCAPSTCAGVDLQADSQNCGACGHDCLGAACGNGTCAPTTLTQEMVEPTEMIADGDSLYLNLGTTVGKLSKSGGALTMISQPGPSILYLATGGGRVYFEQNDVGADGGTTDTYGVYAVSETGGAKMPVVTKSNPSIRHLAIRPPNGYFLSDCANVTEFPIATGVLQYFGSSACNTSGAPPFAVDPSAKYAYATNYERKDVFRVDLQAGTTETIEAHDPGIEKLIANDDAVYFSYAGVILGAMDPDGTNPRTLVDARTLPQGDAGFGSLSPFVIDDTKLYFEVFDARGFSDTVYSVPLRGGPPVALHRSTENRVAALAVDDQYVYFGDDYQIQRTAK